MKYWVAMTMLLVITGSGLALAPDPVVEPRQKVLVQLSVGTGATLVGFKVTRQELTANTEPACTPGRFCLRLPFDCALVLESATADGSGVVVRPQIGPIAFEVTVGPGRTSGS
jgi:hypothetical protein